MCAGVDLCTIGNIFVSLALFGEGDVMSIVLLEKMCKECIFSFFLFNLTQFVFFFCFLSFFFYSRLFFFFYIIFEHYVFRKQKTN